jgi:integrase/recombinase XerD
MRSIGQASVLSESDWKKLESVANQKHRLLWSILRFTAARINEALELRTKDVYKDAIKRIPLDEIVFRQETRKGKDKHHTVPICSGLRIKLRDYTPSPNPEDYLFPGIIDILTAVKRTVIPKPHDLGFCFFPLRGSAPALTE